MFDRFNSAADTVANPQMENYKVAASASALFGFIGFVSSLQCGGLTTWLGYGSALFTMGLAANQFFAEQRIFQNAKTKAMTMFGDTPARKATPDLGATPQVQEEEKRLPLNLSA